MPSRPLKVLLVADDRALLRHLSRFLEAFGYQVRQAAGNFQALAAVESERPDFLILDDQLKSRGALELCRLAGAKHHAGYPYTLLLVERPDPEGLTESLALGVDDLLGKPVVHGELLARLRAGARVLEQDRRVREQSSAEAVTGLPSRAALVDRCAKQISPARADDRPVACVLLDLDYFQRVSSMYGREPSDRVLREVAEILTQLVDASGFLAHLGADRFAVLLVGSALDEAVAWAERARARLAGAELSCGQTALQITVSCGVAAAGGERLPDRILQRAAAALELAKRSGRDCVVHFHQFPDEDAAWAELAAPGKFFQHTVARDIMTPCTVLVQPDDPVHVAAALMSQTGLSAIPVVDARGKLVGIVRQESVAVDGDRESTALDRPLRAVRDVMDGDVPTGREDASFTEIMDFFATETNESLYVVHEGRPTGRIDRAGLTALSRPVTSATFSAVEPFSLASRYLLVADP